MMKIEGKKEKFLSFSSWDWPWLFHGFTTRWVVEKKEFINKGKSIKDIFKPFLQDIGCGTRKVVNAQQVHGDKVQFVEEREFYPKTDGLITDKPKITLLAFFADCTPVFLVVPRKRIVGIIHAGWKGTAQEITKKSIKKLIEEKQVNPAEIRAGIGPTIGPCCYQVDIRVARYFDCSSGLKPQKSGSFSLDLARANFKQMEEAGVPPANIERSGYCTSCNSHLFYSHRRDRGITGRMAGVIAIN